MANSAKRLFDELCPKIQGVHTFRNLQTAFFVVAKLVLLTFMAIIILLAASKYPATVPINVFEIDVLFREKTSAKLFCHLKWYSAPTYFKLYLSIKFFWINQETEFYFLDITWRMKPRFFNAALFINEWCTPFIEKLRISFLLSNAHIFNCQNSFQNFSIEADLKKVRHCYTWTTFESKHHWLGFKSFLPKEDFLPIRCPIKLDPLP